MMRTTRIRTSILVLAIFFAGAGPALAGGIAIVSTSLTDNGDNDGYADSHETATLFLTVKNTSGSALRESNRKKSPAPLSDLPAR